MIAKIFFCPRCSTSSGSHLKNPCVTPAYSSQKQYTHGENVDLQTTAYNLI